MISRRALLVGGGVGTAGLAVGAVVERTRLRRILGWTGPDGVVPSVPPDPVSVTRRQSSARGCSVDVVTMNGTAGFPVCVVLHGRGNTARGMITLGLPQFLAAAKARFTMVAVDGGDSYWVPRTPSDDPQRMLREELPGWLRDLGLGEARAVLGISMGGFGGLVYARAAGLPAAVLSPALFRSWDDAATVGAFASEAQWSSYEPLRHSPPSRLGVWCGEEDPFCDAARELAPHAEVAAFDHGEHTDGYWRRVLPDAIGYLGKVLAY
ncbi:alpha/beta hydrolase [Kutzneria sp. CA-103260]|uniref:alpha/beta hydrolase n=1 Tax=Kutzneria sp. CA-103260 TaxID=2802641 RepID=UPI001BAA5728|nr:alpha/beta hydrolase-fold protein [Kutzneria sp. CA-103260]